MSFAETKDVFEHVTRRLSVVGALKKEGLLAALSTADHVPAGPVLRFSLRPDYGCTGSTMVQQGLMSLTELGNKRDNEMIGGMVAGTFADIGRTQANTGLAIQYNDAMYESMGRYQGNLENLRTANTSKLMAQEGAITGGLMDKQGKLQQEGLSCRR